MIYNNFQGQKLKKVKPKKLNNSDKTSKKVIFCFKD